MCQLCATTPSTEPCDSITVIPNLDRAFNLDTDVICVFLGKDGAVNIGEDEAIHLRVNIELYWQEVEIVLVGLKCLFSNEDGELCTE